MSDRNAGRVCPHCNHKKFAYIGTEHGKYDGRYKTVHKLRCLNCLKIVILDKHEIK